MQDREGVETLGGAVPTNQQLRAHNGRLHHYLQRGQNDREKFALAMPVATRRAYLMPSFLCPSKISLSRSKKTSVVRFSLLVSIRFATQCSACAILLLVADPMQGKNLATNGRLLLLH